MYQASDFGLLPGEFIAGRAGSYRAREFSRRKEERMRAITIKGFKKTGKTTTCLRIISELTRRGYSVGSVKNTHFPDFAIDTPGTDSYRHAKAGASTVTIIGNDETDVLFQRHVELPELIHLYREDFLISEGEEGMGFSNIVCGKTTEQLDQRRDENTIGFSGIIAGEITEHDGLPVIDATGDDLARLVDLIEERSTEL